jgi:prolyl-tRNA synthetase
LPRTLYHIQWKFRDEVRPRFGVMRGREFLMKDAYSFDLDLEGAAESYMRQMIAYLRTFERMGLIAIPMSAASGPIGGESHEFIVLAKSGESEVYYHPAWEDSKLVYPDADAPYSELIEFYHQSVDHPHRYAATDEQRNPSKEAFVGKDLRVGRGIEVGHIFRFGDKYSGPMGLRVSGRDGTPVTPMMGSYGVGVSRLVGAIIEASHDEAGIVWPEPVAPWRVGIVTMRADDEASVSAAETLYTQLIGAGVETLYDDRDERGGVKLGSMDLIGLPWQVIIGPRGIAAGTVELKRRSTGEREELSLESALARLTA